MELKKKMELKCMLRVTLHHEEYNEKITLLEIIR